jgi:hypothetical protein
MSLSDDTRTFKLSLERFVKAADRIDDLRRDITYKERELTNQSDELLKAQAEMTKILTQAGVQVPQDSGRLLEFFRQLRGHYADTSALRKAASE